MHEAPLSHVLEQRPSDSPRPRCTALLALSLIATMQGHVEQAGELMRSALDVADRDGSGEAQMLAPRMFSAYHLVMADRTAEVHAVIESGAGVWMRVNFLHLCTRAFSASRAVPRGPLGRRLGRGGDRSCPRGGDRPAELDDPGLCHCGPLSRCTAGNTPAPGGRWRRPTRSWTPPHERSLVHHSCVGGRQAAGAPLGPAGPSPTFACGSTATMSSARSGGPGRADWQ